MRWIHKFSQVAPAFCMMLIIINFVFVRFVHYQSQYHYLDPQHYKVKVVTSEDYQNLSNPENRSVKLSNGTTITKAESWNSRVLPKYKSTDDGSLYVLVTVKGTAPFVRRWLSDMLPIFAILLFALIGQLPGRNQKNENIQQA